MLPPNCPKTRPPQARLASIVPSLTPHQSCLQAGQTRPTCACRHKRIPIEYSAALIRDDQDNPKYIVSIGRDVTERQKAQQRFRLAAESATDLIYEWDIESDALEWYGDIDEALGFKPGEIPRTIEGWVSRIHPEDQKKLRNAVEIHRTTTKPIYEEYRIKRKDGSWSWWIDRGMPVLNHEGKPTMWIGGCSDVTDIRKAEKRLADYSKNLEKLVKLRTKDLEK